MFDRRPVGRVPEYAARPAGLGISDVLALTIAQALSFFTQRGIVRKLQALNDVGLGYLTLG